MNKIALPASMAAQATESSEAEEQFLRFQLLPDTTALLPVHQTTEVLAVTSSQVIPIPHMPAYILGIYNWRGEILWMLDLGHLLGLAPKHQRLSTSLDYPVLVIHDSRRARGRKRTSGQATGEKLLGLVVDQVEDMEWLNPELIQSPPVSAVTPELAPFLSGYFVQPNGEFLMALDGDSIIARMTKPEV
ncbi:chemotaxis protein CheW [Leptolyngbya sp. FACHB-261]|uniref:chemotaxis protein CheW n=1 Tax=Leptolyngbya sp. FACHB-261 TaxID=2692806 RepID=UPI0028C4C906|nr:chemotaxis protein CheW [Leptolyngbya sp. FACHB-261]